MLSVALGGRDGRFEWIENFKRSDVNAWSDFLSPLWMRRILSTTQILAILFSFNLNSRCFTPALVPPGRHHKINHERSNCSIFYKPMFRTWDYPRKSELEGLEWSAPIKSLQHWKWEWRLRLSEPISGFEFTPIVSCLILFNFHFAIRPT